MKMRSVAFALACAGLVLGCSSSGKKVDSDKSSLVAPPSEAHVMTADEINAKYSILELNAVANLLKVAIDESGTKPSKDVGSDLIGCPLTGQQASTMTMPVKMLIDTSLHFESDAYTASPKNYGTEKGFESCASQCACGVLSDVVNGANESSLPQGSSRLHTRNKHNLSIKASHQTARDSLACAKKVSWFCSSDLKTYLAEQAKEDAAP